MPTPDLRRLQPKGVEYELEEWDGLTAISAVNFYGAKIVVANVLPPSLQMGAVLRATGMSPTDARDAMASMGRSYAGLTVANTAAALGMEHVRAPGSNVTPKILGRMCLPGSLFAIIRGITAQEMPDQQCTDSLRAVAISGQPGLRDLAVVKYGIKTTRYPENKLLDHLHKVYEPERLDPETSLEHMVLYAICAGHVDPVEIAEQQPGYMPAIPVRWKAGQVLSASEITSEIEDPLPMADTGPEVLGGSTTAAVTNDGIRRSQLLTYLAENGGLPVRFQGNY